MQKMSPNAAAPLLLAMLACLTMWSAAADAQTVYKWTDKRGQTHYGDRVPPEYATQDRELINRQGITVGREEGTITDEELKAQKERERIARIKAEAALRDRMLVTAYQSVEEIELVRGRRLDQIDSQIQLLKLGVDNLVARHRELVKRSNLFKPFNDDPKAEPMPAGLMEDIKRTESEIDVQRANLDLRIRSRTEINDQFDADIARFNQLRAGG